MLPDVVIINPGEERTIYGGLADDLTAIEPPIWCRIIAGYLRSKGFSVNIIDMVAQNISPRSLSRFVIGRPKLAVIVAHGHQPSASTQTMTGVGSIAVRFNRMDIPCIVVGGHVSALPEHTIKTEPVRYACDGEGPITIEGLLNQTPKEFIPGLVYRDDTEWDGDYKKIRHNKSARLLYPETSELEGEAWDLLDMNLYRAHPWQVLGDFSRRKPYASIYTSFGCPYKCQFCMINAPFHSNKYRMRKPARVVAEIVSLYHDYGVRTFKFADEMFVLNENHYGEICSRLIESGISHDINIWAYARVDTVRENKLALLREAGIKWLALGIESASKHVRDGAQKALRNDDIIGTVRSLQAADINVIGNYIFGLEDDDDDSMEETMKLALECKTEFANFYSVMAYPGSKLYDEALAKGRELPERWSGYSQHSYDCQPLGNDRLSPEDVLQFRDNAFMRYFTDALYLDHVGNKFGSDAVNYIMNMTGHTLRRKILEKTNVAV